MNTKTIQLKSIDICPLLNILNEVNHGIRIFNFEKTIGAKKQFVIDLWEKIFKEKNKENPTISFDNLELEVINNSFEEVYRQIDAWEFQTRLGITIPEMKKIQNKILSD